WCKITRTWLPVTTWIFYHPEMHSTQPSKKIRNWISGPGTDTTPIQTVVTWRAAYGLESCLAFHPKKFNLYRMAWNRKPPNFCEKWRQRWSIISKLLPRGPRQLSRHPFRNPLLTHHRTKD